LHESANYINAMSELSILNILYSLRSIFIYYTTIMYCVISKGKRYPTWKERFCWSI